MRILKANQKEMYWDVFLSIIRTSREISTMLALELTLSSEALWLALEGPGPTGIHINPLSETGYGYELGSWGFTTYFAGGKDKKSAKRDSNEESIISLPTCTEREGSYLHPTSSISHEVMEVFKAKSWEEASISCPHMSCETTKICVRADIHVTKVRWKCQGTSAILRI